MKQKTIKTDKATVLVVELPEGAKEVSCGLHCIGVKPEPTEHLGVDSNGWYHVYRKMFHGWQLLGRLPDITEEQVDGAVEKVVFEDEEFGDIIKYRDYTAIPIGKHNKRYAPITALKSLYSLLQDNEVYFENPLGKLHPTHPAYTGEGITVKEWIEKCKKWQQAQSKVWDKERCYLFIKVD